MTLYAALGALVAEFDGGAIDIGWTVTAYLVAAAIASTLCGRLADAYGPRQVMLTASHSEVRAPDQDGPSASAALGTFRLIHWRIYELAGPVSGL